LSSRLVLLRNAASAAARYIAPVSR
jgi:hypothetical protein